MIKYVILVNKDDSLIGKVSSEIYESLEDALIFISSRGSNVIMGYNPYNWYDKITGTYYKILPVNEVSFNPSKIYYGVKIKIQDGQKETSIIVKNSIMKPKEEKYETLTTTITTKYFNTLSEAEEYISMMERK